MNAAAVTAHVELVAEVLGMRVLPRTPRVGHGFALLRVPTIAAVCAASAVVYTQLCSFIA